MRERGGEGGRGGGEGGGGGGRSVKSVFNRAGVTKGLVNSVCENRAKGKLRHFVRVQTKRGVIGKTVCG